MKNLIFSLPLICLGLGCAASYNVGVNGYSSSGQTLQIQKESSIQVVPDSNAPNPILEKEIAAKIQKLLNKKGYTTETDKADYYLLFDYGISSGRYVTRSYPVYHSDLYCDYPFSYGYRHGYTTYMAYSSIVYDRWLVLRLIDSNDYKAFRKSKPLWIGEAASSGPGSDLRKLINYLLVAALEHFGRDTGKQVNVLFSDNDERIKPLTEH